MKLQSKLPSQRRLQIRRGLWIGIGVAAFVLLLWNGGFFAQIRLRLSNAFYVPAPTSSSIVIVALDDASLAKYGRSMTAWPRILYGDLIQKLSTARARVAAFDVLFAEPADDDQQLADAIQTARTGEARTRVIMPAAGVQSGTNAAVPHAIEFERALKPASLLASAVDNLGYVNTFPDVDGFIRRQPSQIIVDGQASLSFSMATYLAYLRIPAAAIPQLIKVGPDLFQLPQRSIPVDESGFWLQNYFGPPYSASSPTFPIVSLVDVLTDKADMTQFDDKIVLVGVVNTVGLSDSFPVPIDSSGRMMSGVEIHANAIETLIQNRPLREQPAITQMLAIVLLALFASTLYAQLRWQWIVAAAVVLLIGWVIAAFVLFSTNLVVVNVLHSSLAILLPAGVHLGVTITLEINRRQRAEFLLQSLVELSRQRLEVDKTLSYLAQDIQQILHADRGIIWLWNNDKNALQHAYRWPEWSPSIPHEFEPLALQTQHQDQVIINAGQLGVTVRWQGRLLAVITAQLPSGRLSAAALRLLDKFTEEIAPGLENVILHAEMRRQKFLMETLIANSPAGIMVFDHDLYLRIGNFAVDKMFALATPGFVNRPLTNLLNASSVPETVQNELMTAFQAKQSFRQEIKHNNKTFIWDGVFLRHTQEWIVLLNDVTTLSELSEFKTHMIRMASHDLKNPLSSILGYGALMLEEPSVLQSPEQVRQFITEMVKSGEHMLHIIEDILNLERLRSVKADYRPVNLAEIVRAVIERQQFEFEAKGQQLDADIRADLLLVIGDAPQLTQAVTNLIGNASKYTPDGGHIWVRLFQKKDLIHFEVQDNGYGISEQAQEKLFQEFYRVRTRATAHIMGTGLGLSLVKSVVEAHGGRIWVSSIEGEGTTFFVEFPIVREQPENEPV